MQTRCPHCQTSFRVTQAQLDAAQGKVRCGQCQQVFNAQEHISQPAEKPETATTEIAPPQVDWLQQENPDDFDHIDLGTSAPKASDIKSIKISETEIDTTEGFTKPEAEFTADDEALAPKITASADTDDSIADDFAGEEEESDLAITTENKFASEDSLIPGGPNESLQDIEKEMILPGIAPAYEDDSYLNAREEQGLNDLQGEIHRQLHTPTEETAADTEVDAYDNALDYLEDVEEQPAKTSPVEKIELNAIPEDTGNTVNWNDDVHHDPEVPAALRSSMQALQQKKKRHPLLSAFMALVLVVLIADLGVQAVVFRSYDIATQWPQSRELLTKVCNYLPCVYSGRREPRKIQLVSRDVRVHPKAKHALLISATLVNQAGYAQPYPRLAIRLSDLSGDVVAEREFAPQDYLKADESKLKLLRPDIPTLITLEVLDPGSEAVNFEFRFL